MAVVHPATISTVLLTWFLFQSSVSCHNHEYPSLGLLEEETDPEDAVAKHSSYSSTMTSFALDNHDEEERILLALERVDVSQNTRRAAQRPSNGAKRKRRSRKRRTKKVLQGSLSTQKNTTQFNNHQPQATTNDDAHHESNKIRNQSQESMRQDDSAVPQATRTQDRSKPEPSSHSIATAPTHAITDVSSSVTKNLQTRTSTNNLQQIRTGSDKLTTTTPQQEAQQNTSATAAATNPNPMSSTTTSVKDTRIKSVATKTTTTTPWVRQYLLAHPKDMLLPVPRDYLEDHFNLAQLPSIVESIVMEGRDGEDDDAYLAGLGQSPSSDSTSSSRNTKRSQQYPLYREALKLILQQPPSDNKESPPLVYKAAEVLFLLIHARYVVSPRGLEMVRRILLKNDASMEPIFGRCPRMGCNGMALLPYGESDNWDPASSRMTRAKRYCCCCGEAFFLWDSKVDGCAWGPSFCHLFLLVHGRQVFPHLNARRAWLRRQMATACDSNGSLQLPTSSNQNSLIVRPTIFGFQLHPSASSCFPYYNK